MIEFREDLKNLMRSCGGGAGKLTSFIFTDNSIKEEAFLEDINNILNINETYCYSYYSLNISEVIFNVFDKLNNFAPNLSL